MEQTQGSLEGFLLHIACIYRMYYLKGIGLLVVSCESSFCRVVTNRNLRWSQISIYGGKKVVHTKTVVHMRWKKVGRRGHRWSQTGTAVSHGHPEFLICVPSVLGTVRRLRFWEGIELVGGQESPRVA